MRSDWLARWRVRTSVAPSDGETLVWDNTLRLWKPGGRRLSATAVWNPPDMATDGAIASTTITVTGAALGDFSVATFSGIGAQNITISANVQATDTVRVILTNRTGGDVDLASGTLSVIVLKAS